MHQKSIFTIKRVLFVRLLLDLSTENEEVKSHGEYEVHESRATRLVGDSLRFMTVTFTKQTRETHLRKWLENMTKPGESIEYGDAKYVFLGFTESGLKAGNIIFFAEGPDFSVADLKAHFGSDLKTVFDTFGYGKYSARLGLSFSSTVATKEIDPAERHLLPDLTAADGSLHTDGCGLIRDSFAQEISALLHLPHDIAVFQIRLGGIKGTLTRCPDDLFDSTCGCRGKTVAYRPSMVKYNEGPHVLEVQNVSRPPKAGRLNKQFIVLLLTRGIPLSVFEDLLKTQLEEIDKITLDREKALNCIDGEVDAECTAFYQDLYEMLLAGHDMSEPYLASQLLKYQKTAREGLRKKMNLTVKRSGYFLGVVDHCGVLKEGEVYINIPTRGGAQVGTVALMRNPAHDPDGVRVLEAVNRPELKHLTNCIVFAATGARSEPDRMGGGDLDGDTFFAVFDPLLIPKRRDPPKPVATAKQPRARSKTITIGGRTQKTISATGRQRNSDMRTAAIETFVSMRCNFLLGSLSNEWTSLVGATPELADSPICRRLVPMIEAALDIVKSGSGLAVLRSDFDLFKNELENIPQAPSGWVNPLERLANLVPRPLESSMTEFTPDPQLVLREKTTEERWAEVIEEAEAVMPRYNSALRNAIEADKEAKLQEDDSRRADIVKEAFIKRHFPPIDNILEDTPKYLLKASAWYVTGYSKGKQSFAWLGGRWLNAIKASSCGHIPISVGARSTPLTGAIVQAPSNASPAKQMPTASTTPAPSAPPRPISTVSTTPAPAPMVQAQVTPPSRHVPIQPQTETLFPTSGSDTETDYQDVDSDEFEVIDRESVYDTAAEDIVPTVTRRPTRPIRPLVRDNSDDTLVDEPQTPPSPPRTLRTRRPSPTTSSPSSDRTERPVAGRRRIVASPERVMPVSVTATASVITRTCAQTRAPEPSRAQTRAPDMSRARSEPPVRTPAAPKTHGQKVQGHTHEFLLRPNKARVCECGTLWNGGNA
ncbi:RNA-dependent RNA polymerase [Favolaschia claudopus]|uniref:RNA-dependent RNA polymerase n=1 Tax=Favolaschia claudopus TaxID=2862362 RepID=A0AAW0CYB6_9AGAR